MSNVLRGNMENKVAGNFVLNNQAVAADQGFRNVSSIWFKKGTISYENGLELLEQGRAQTEDIHAPLSAMVPALGSDGGFVMKCRDGRVFRPTTHAMVQMGDWSGAGSWFIKQLMENPTNHKGEPLFARDRGDAETLVSVLRNGFRRVEKEKVFLWRTRQDGTLRAMLSDKYSRVDNRWYIETMQKLVPGGRLSHWRGDQDTIYGNILIPDTIREERDSDYGGMLSIGNSEIGERRVSSAPSIFRAICMNGMVHGAEKGVAIKVVHRGSIDLEKLFLIIKENINEQIPLLPQGIDRLLATRTMLWDGASILPLFAEAANAYKLSKRQASLMLECYNTERNVAPETARSLFGLTASITRAGQKLQNADWLRMDEIGGRLSEMGIAEWSKMVSRAKSLTSKEVEGAFLGLAV